MNKDDLSFISKVSNAHLLKKGLDAAELDIFNDFLKFADIVYNRYLSVNKCIFDLGTWGVDHIVFDFNYYCLDNLDTLDRMIGSVLMIDYYHRNNKKGIKVAYDEESNLVIETYYFDGLNDTYPMYFLKTFDWSDREIDDAMIKIHETIQRLKELEVIKRTPSNND